MPPAAHVLMPKKIKKPAKWSSKPYPKMEVLESEYCELVDGEEDEYIEVDPVHWDEWAVMWCVVVIVVAIFGIALWRKLSG